MADRIQMRRDTKARWEQYNPVLLEGEVGIVTDDPNLYKVGNGTSAWNSLPYRGFNGTVTSTITDEENTVPSNKAVKEGLENVIHTTDVLQELGINESYPMSQKAISESIFDVEKFASNETYFYTKEGYINLEGNVNKTPYWCYIDIEAKEGDKILVYTNFVSNACGLVFFNKDNNIISKEIGDEINNNTIERKVIIAPAGTVRLKSCCIKNIADKTFLTRINSLEGNTDAIIDKINSVDFIPGNFLNADGTEGYKSPLWGITPYILVELNEKYKIDVYGEADVTSAIVFYDKDKNIISTIPSSITGVETFEGVIEDSNIKYVRCCSYIDRYKESKCILYTLINEIISNVYSELNEKIESLDNKILNTFHYGNNLNKPYLLKGKRAVFYGDSVTYGVASNPFGNITECWRKIFSDISEFSNSINKAVSGAYFSGSENLISTQIINSIDTSFSNNWDLIIIAGGINDYWTGREVGTLSDITTDTVYGGLHVICEHIKTNAPKASVIFITPLNCSRTDLSRVKYPLWDYRKAIFEVAVMYGHSVIDGSQIGFPIDSTVTPYKQALIEDGVHPTALGHRIMAQNIYSILS